MVRVRGGSWLLIGVFLCALLGYVYFGDARYAMAILVGGALGVGGIVMQSVLQNPMADAGMLGISSGSALGAIGVLFLCQQGYIMAGCSVWSMRIGSFVGGTIIAWIIYLASLRERKHNTINLILVGMGINALVGSGIGSIMALADTTVTKDYIFWVLGSLEVTDRSTVIICSIFIISCVFILYRMAFYLEALVMGCSESYHLGIDSKKYMRLVIMICVIMVGVTVAVCGMIGFVGLVVPHGVRTWVGLDMKKGILWSGIMGAVMLILGDWLARCLSFFGNIPIGVVMGFLGGLWLLLARPTVYKSY